MLFYLKFEKNVKILVPIFFTRKLDKSKGVSPWFLTQKLKTKVRGLVHAFFTQKFEKKWKEVGLCYFFFKY